MIYDFSALSLTGQKIPMSTYKGKVLLIVNTASECGLTPQYEGLEKLYQEYKEKGLEILGFPCNQFGGQEPGSSEEIGQFCKKNYGVSFQMFDKIDVNGPNTHEIFKFLKSEKKGLLFSEAIKWNFTKFLVDRSGEVVARYAPTQDPLTLRKDIEKLLA